MLSPFYEQTASQLMNQIQSFRQQAQQQAEGQLIAVTTPTSNKYLKVYFVKKYMDNIYYYSLEKHIFQIFHLKHSN